MCYVELTRVWHSRLLFILFLVLTHSPSAAGLLLSKTPWKPKRCYGSWHISVPSHTLARPYFWFLYIVCSQSTWFFLPCIVNSMVKLQFYFSKANYWFVMIAAWKYRMTNRERSLDLPSYDYRVKKFELPVIIITY